MNASRFLLSAFIGFIFVFAFDFALHGTLLMPVYNETPELWRSEAEMAVYFPFMMVMQLSLATVLAYIFTLNYEGRGIMEGIRFGFPMGLLVGTLQFTVYAYMPISLELALYWLGGSIIQITCLGMIYSMIYKEG